MKKIGGTDGSRGQFVLPPKKQMTPPVPVGANCNVNVSKGDHLHQLNQKQERAALLMRTQYTGALGKQEIEYSNPSNGESLRIGDESATYDSGDNNNNNSANTLDNNNVTVVRKKIYFNRNFYVEQDVLVRRIFLDDMGFSICEEIHDPGSQDRIGTLPTKMANEKEGGRDIHVLAPKKD